MKRRGLLATAGAALLATSIAQAEEVIEEYWVEYPDETWLVGEVETDAAGQMTIRSMYLSTGEESTSTTLYAVPFIDTRAGGLLDEEGVASWGGFALARAYKLSSERVIMTAEWYPVSNSGADGEPNGGGTGSTPGDGGTTPAPPPVSEPFHPFFSAMIYDEQGQWASILNVYIADAIQQIIELLQAQPDDWTAGSGQCIPPAPPGQPVFRTVTPAGTLEGRQWGHPTIPADNSITVFPVGQHQNCVTYQTLPDFPEPGPGPGNVRWIIKNHDVAFNRPIFNGGGDPPPDFGDRR